MALVGFKAQNHPQQTGKRGARPEIDDRQTPPELFDPLHARFRFTVDVAALPHNAKLPCYFTPEQDGLEQSWVSERVWCNPPYSHIKPWVVKAWRSWAELVVMLVPANRTEQRWWQDLVEPFRDTPYRLGGPFDHLRVEFLAGRQRFIAHDADGIRPYGVALLIWGRGDGGRG